MRLLLFILFSAAFSQPLLDAKPVWLTDRALHLRSGMEREWRSFPATALGSTGTLIFATEINPAEYSLVLRQRDVKKTNWIITLNGQRLGRLQDDERSMVRVLPVPARALRSGSNTLAISGDASGFSDDIEVRDIRIEPFPVSRFLAQATLSLTATGEQGPLPLKIAIVDSKRSLIPFTSLRTGAYEAQRTGVLYAVDGAARIGLPAGEYRVYASRGFEYSAPFERIRLKPGDVQAIRLQLRREVELPGYVSCDPHVHTFELSRHGDASVDERVLTAAGEGLDFIVSTEHNRVDDYSPALEKRGLEKWTRAIPGSEVTTAMGHFNIFPARPGSIQPDPKSPDWSTLMDSIRKTQGVQVIVQNHPRDLHMKYRPFDPAHHLSGIGANLNGRQFSANAMEVVNSGAMSSDVMQLVRDWLGLLTRGLGVAAIGSSDTHTVDFVPIGQARTYIQAESKDSSAVFRALAQGRNLVSYGLATELRAVGSEMEVTVHGPSWSSVDRVEVYSNGRLVWQESFAPVQKAGVKYKRTITLELLKQDAAIAAVASGPGVLEPFWEVRKPYQPMSDGWTPRVLGISAAVWVDGDGDGGISPPIRYAARLVAESDLSRLVSRLGAYDPSVTMHTLELLRAGGDLRPEVREAFEHGPQVVRDVYVFYLEEVRKLRR